MAAVILGARNQPRENEIVVGRESDVECKIAATGCDSKLKIEPPT